METVSCVSALQNYLNFSDVIAERPEQASENCEPMKNEQVKIATRVCIKIEGWFCITIFDVLRTFLLLRFAYFS